jgi:hypothetical protein
MVANLVGNAIRHNQTGGFIDVITEADARAARLIVKNGGRCSTLTRLPTQYGGRCFRRAGVDR